MIRIIRETLYLTNRNLSRGIVIRKDIVDNSLTRNLRARKLLFTQDR